MNKGSQPSDRTPKWSLFLPYVLVVLGLFVLLLLTKGVAVLIAHRFLYEIPILGGIARSLELVEFFNLVLFSILGMGLGLSVRLLPSGRPDRMSRSVLTILIPVLFLSGSFFQYQIWLSDVRHDMNLNAIEVRRVTNEWLDQTVDKTGLWGFYHYTTRYSILPTNPDRLRASIQGSDRVNQLFAQLFSATPAFMGNVLSFCILILRVFYFALAILTAVHHFQDGLERGKYPLWPQKIRPKRGKPRLKTYGKLK